MNSPLHTIYHPFTSWVVCLRSSALVLYLITLVSCADDQEDGCPTSPVQAVFTTFVSGSEAAFPQDPVINPWTSRENEIYAHTRAANDTWTSGDRIGIYMLTSGGSIATASHIKANNIPYHTTGGGTHVSLIPTNNPIYYPLDGSKVNFVAYYPYQSSFATAHTYAVNVASQTSQEAIDLLYHKSSTDYSQYNAAAALTFSHQLSKIIINITRGAGVSSDLTALSSSITGMPTKASFALATGTLSSQGTVAPFATHKVTASTTSTKSVQEAIIIPHKGSGAAPVFTNRTITFTVGGNTYTYPLPDSMNFEAGKVYNFNFSLTMTRESTYVKG